MTAIVEIGLEAMAHLKTVILGHGHIAQIEQPMDVRPQQKAVGGIMFAAITIGSDMRGIENWQRLLV